MASDPDSSLVTTPAAEPEILPPKRRQRGRSKKTLMRVFEARVTGPMPDDVMLRAMRFYMAEFEAALRRTPRTRDDKLKKIEDEIKFLELARNAAEGAAPYFHAKLTAHKVYVDQNLPVAIDVTALSDQQIDVLIERIAVSVRARRLALGAADGEAGQGQK